MCFLCSETSCKDNVLFPFAPQMKRAGTTGSARGMALYEEEVSTEWIRQLHSGSGVPLFSPRPSPSLLFLPNHLPVGSPESCSCPGCQDRRPGGCSSHQEPEGGEAPSCHSPNTLEFLGLGGRSSGSGRQSWSGAPPPPRGRGRGSLSCVPGQGWAWATCPSFWPGSLCDTKAYIYVKTGWVRQV